MSSDAPSCLFIVMLSQPALPSHREKRDSNCVMVLPTIGNHGTRFNGYPALLDRGCLVWGLDLRHPLNDRSAQCLRNAQSVQAGPSV